MKFSATELNGVFVLETERRADDRGFFARTFCCRELETYGVVFQAVEACAAYSHAAGILRGLRYQVVPALQRTLVRCTRGSVFYVAVDFRPGSSTYLQHVGVELSEDNQRALFVPAMMAQGHQALLDGTEVTWWVDQDHSAGCERGVRYDDSRLGVRWPLPVTWAGTKDEAWPAIAAHKHPVEVCD